MVLGSSPSGPTVILAAATGEGRRTTAPSREYNGRMTNLAKPRDTQPHHRTAATLADLHSRLASEIAARQEMERRLAKLQTAYARFVPPQLLELLGKESILDVAWGNQVEKKMTVLFSDIRGFAALSERMSPQQCFDFINAYLSFMEPVVLAHGGFIDKYIGDAVMALFPTRGDDALRAALAMLAEVERFNTHWAAGLPGLPEARPGQPVRIGIGLNSGLLMLGVIGGSQRMEVTVISDAVNLAARIETLTKTYQTPLLITQHTLNSMRAPADFSIRFLDRVHLPGKHLAQSIYEVFDGDPPPLKAAKQANLDLFEEALALYHFRQIDSARRSFHACLERCPDDTPALIHWQRCSQTGRLPDPPDGEVGWHAEFLLGHEEPDRAHRLIFDHLLALAKALQTEATGRASELARRLDEIIAEHFASEERLMTAHGYPAPVAAEHRQQHARLIAFFSTLRAAIGGSTVSPLRLAFRCQFLLLDWFTSHFVITDRHLFRFLAEQGVK
ncbi:MAG: hemerythrin domain-containing protein [Ferrovibrio sp.]